MQESRFLPAEGMILSGGGVSTDVSEELCGSPGTVIGWLSGESRKKGAEGESGKSRESLRQKDSDETVQGKKQGFLFYTGI